MRSSLLVVAALPLLLLGAPAAAQESQFGEPRFRLGTDMGLGLSWDARGTPGGAMHTGVRAGVQIDDVFAIYYQARLAGLGVEIEPERTVWLLTTSNGVSFDITLVDVVQLGAGLSVDHLTGNICGRRLCFGPDEGTYLGIDLRVAFTAWARRNVESGMRSGILVGARWHLTALPEQRSGLGAINTLTVDASWELY